MASGLLAASIATRRQEKRRYTEYNILIYIRYRALPRLFPSFCLPFWALGGQDEGSRNGKTFDILDGYRLLDSVNNSQSSTISFENRIAEDTSGDGWITMLYCWPSLYPSTITP